MGMLLKRTFNLVALKVTLDTRGERAQVVFELEVTEEHEPRTVWKLAVPIGEIGLSENSGSERSDAGVDRFRLPDSLASGVAEQLANAGYDGVVWLHLVKPYGMLGAVPWERLLDIGRPLLRLPDALGTPPAEVSRTLDVIICASRPISEAAFNIPRHLGTMAERIARSVEGRRVRVNVFTDLECTRALEDTIARQGLADKVVVWNPHESYESAQRNRRPGSAPVKSPWLLWILEKMRGKSVDVVHFLCHGYLAQRSGALAFAESPTLNKDPLWSRFVGAGELGAFLMHLGAWSVAFSSPDHNYSEMGLRLLADEFAQVKPGPVLYHDCSHDPSMDQLGAAYRFLYSHDRLPPPPMPAVALCCQPALVAGAGAAVTADSAAANAAVEQAGLEELPAWVAAVHRFCEQKEFQVSSLSKSRERLSARAGEDVQGVTNGVDEIRQTLDRLMKKGLL